MVVLVKCLDPFVTRFNWEITCITHSLEHLTPIYNRKHDYTPAKQIIPLQDILFLRKDGWGDTGITLPVHLSLSLSVCLSVQNIGNFVLPIPPIG